MKRFSNIVFVSESNECDRASIKQAVALAQTNQAKLTIVGYFDNLKSLSQNQPNANILIQEMLEYKREKLNEFVGEFIQDIETEIKIFFGKPFIDIIQEVLKFDRDLLIKSVDEPKGISNAFFGSLDLKLCENVHARFG